MTQRSGMHFILAAALALAFAGPAVGYEIKFDVDVGTGDDDDPFNGSNFDFSRLAAATATARSGDAAPTYNTAVTRGRASSASNKRATGGNYPSAPVVALPGMPVDNAGGGKKRSGTQCYVRNRSSGKVKICAAALVAGAPGTRLTRVQGAPAISNEPRMTITSKTTYQDRGGLNGATAENTATSRYISSPSTAMRQAQVSEPATIVLTGLLLLAAWWAQRLASRDNRSYMSRASA